MQIDKNGEIVTELRSDLSADGLSSDDIERIVETAAELVSQLPSPSDGPVAVQGLLLGLVQSGKTNALMTAIAMAADNGYRCFIVLTSDNLWLYGQTVSRLRSRLPLLRIVGKDEWNAQKRFLASDLRGEHGGIVLVTTKNAKVIGNLISLVDSLADEIETNLPLALIVDDEADQASLDTQTRRRATDPNIDPGKISELIEDLRLRFASHAFVQVTATPQALFLQDPDTSYRPEFTVVIEPGKGYIGGNTFFSLVDHGTPTLIRHVEQADLNVLTTTSLSVDRVDEIPKSLRNALNTFFIGAAVKLIRAREDGRPATGYSCLVHISPKKNEHELVYDAVAAYYEYVKNALVAAAGSPIHDELLTAMRAPYLDIQNTVEAAGNKMPSFENVLELVRRYISNAEIQIINSDQTKDEPRYDSRFNIIIGGAKLARGVTIPNLLVTYYGRQAQQTNMDTMLQHARMYGYRERDIDAIRLFMTSEVENRFKLINESEQALRKVIKEYPNEVYRGIYIGKGVRATRLNVLNPFSVGFYVGGQSYFPQLPISDGHNVRNRREAVDEVLGKLAPDNTDEAIRTSIDEIVRLVRLTESDPTVGGIWDDERIVAALEIQKNDPKIGNVGYLVVRRDRNTNLRAGRLRAVLGGGELNRYRTTENSPFPLLFMFRQTGAKWPGNQPFWLPVVAFPKGRYAMVFNFE